MGEGRFSRQTSSHVPSTPALEGFPGPPNTPFRRCYCRKEVLPTSVLLSLHIMQWGFWACANNTRRLPGTRSHLNLPLETLPGFSIFPKAGRRFKPAFLCQAEGALLLCLTTTYLSIDQCLYVFASVVQYVPRNTTKCRRDKAGDMLETTLQHITRIKSFNS